MSTVLMSIKPEYVSNILNGKKKYEFRKNACKKEIEKMIIYSTSPISKVVGEARIVNMQELTGRLMSIIMRAETVL